jgi:hypothetical protein
MFVHKYCCTDQNSVRICVWSLYKCLCKSTDVLPKIQLESVRGHFIYVCAKILLYWSEFSGKNSVERFTGIYVFRQCINMQLESVKIQIWRCSINFSVSFATSSHNLSKFIYVCPNCSCMLVSVLYVCPNGTCTDIYSS